ncbi:nuclear RNA binding protein [Macrophomina phaseolina MS6]|uniref:Nuclear RNA binding protein n=1 Tax=Macrophomina phaseolina (strain MS6) TaxID=1126212 RepID=K2REU7_MACPH|nr:nuclear RNA binding protein [Macrophomina phaseolina MS6]
MHDTASSDERADQGSRKRRHKSHDVDIERRPRSEVDEASYSSKRRRSANWPLTDEQSLSPDASQRSRYSKGSRNRRQVSSPGRLSRFQEGSMNDRASAQPPSVFTRFFPSRGIAPIDQLMEDYHAANEAAPTYTRSTSRGASHHPNQSVTSAATAGSSSTANTRESGIFRFGRSVASTFNPINIWQKMQQKWSEARQELIEEALDEQARQLRERALKADEVYAHLKKTGQLGTQGTHAISNGAPIFTPGYTAPADGQAIQRDSGIAGIEPDYSRPYEQKDAAKSAANVSSPPERKSALHFRTPSFANLKKARSEAQLAKRAPPSSPTADVSEAATPRTLRKFSSKKDLQKQLKLHKRVSDLEVKLREARQELYDCLGDTPPVPTMPAHLAASLNSNKPRIPTPLRKKASRTGGTMPALPSERLLFPDRTENREEPLVPQEPGASRTDKEQEQEQAASAPESEPPTPTATNDIWIADVEPAKAKKNKATKAAPAKKRKSGGEDDLNYKPVSEDNDDVEWDVAAQDPPKKKRGGPKKIAVPETTPNRKQSDKQAAKTEMAGKQAETRPEGAAVTETVIKEAEKQPTVHASIDEAMESMTEEDVTTAKVLLKDASPGRPSALATPSHPSLRRSARSASPAQRRANAHSQDRSISAAPNLKSIPSMPSVPENLKLQTSKASVTFQKRNASFEWPDDVF